MAHANSSHTTLWLSRQQLQERLYSWDDDIGSNAVEVHLHHLRRKLGPEWIRNVRGVGYKLVVPGPEAGALPPRQ